MIKEKFLDSMLDAFEAIRNIDWTEADNKFLGLVAMAFSIVFFLTLATAGFAAAVAAVILYAVATLAVTWVIISLTIFTVRLFA